MKTSRIRAFAALACVALAAAGCGTINTAVQTYGTQAAANIHDARVTQFQAARLVVCSTGLDVILADPSTIPGIAAMCLPAGATTTPAALLGQIPAVPARNQPASASQVVP